MSMGKGLRTNLKKRTKAKYKGKDQLFESLQMQRGENSKRSPAKLKTVGNLRFKNVAVIDLHGCGKVTDDNIEIRIFRNIKSIRGIVTLMSLGNVITSSQIDPSK